MFEYLLISFAVLALLSIVFEEITHINKAKTTLFFGCISWVALFIHAQPEQQSFLNHHLEENLLEIAVLWLFLMSTMTFVAYLNAKGVIQVAVQKLFPQQLSKRRLMLLVALFALILSAICDNVTATLVTLTLLQSFDLDKKTKLKMAVLTIFAVNSGGVSLITGDVTTLMIFLDGHVKISELLILLVPAVASVFFLTILLSFGTKGKANIAPSELTYERIDVVIAAIFFSTIVLTMVFNILFQIPPVLTFLSGLSIMFLVGRTYKTDTEETLILDFVRKIEYDTLLFFLGILLIVGMLKEIGVLELISEIYSQFDPNVSSFLAGIGSALLDNVPLTAALLKAEPVLTTPQWLGLTYAVGVGGSLLVIGSAAGIIAMSKMKEITFLTYSKFIPALFAAYTFGYVVTILLAQQLY